MGNLEQSLGYFEQSAVNLEQCVSNLEQSLGYFKQSVGNLEKCVGTLEQSWVILSRVWVI